MDKRLTRITQIMSTVLWTLYYLMISTLLDLSFMDIEIYILGLIVFIVVYFFVYMIEGKAPGWYNRINWENSSVENLDDSE